MEIKIAPRNGCEAYVTVKGLICFKQEQVEDFGGREVSFFLHPDELGEMLPRLPDLIEEAREALQEIARRERLGLPPQLPAENDPDDLDESESREAHPLDAE